MAGGITLLSTTMIMVKKRMKKSKKKRLVYISGIKPSVRTVALGGSVLNGSEVYPSTNMRGYSDTIIITDPDDRIQDGYTYVYSDDDEHIVIGGSGHLDYTYVDESGIEQDLAYLDYQPSDAYGDETYTGSDQGDYAGGHWSDHKDGYHEYEDYEHLTMEDGKYGGHYVEEDSEDYEVIHMHSY